MSKFTVVIKYNVNKNNGLLIIYVINIYISYKSLKTQFENKYVKYKTYTGYYKQATDKSNAHHDYQN